MRPRCFWVVCLALAFAACDDVTHERLDAWKQTEQGPGKLANVLAAPHASAAMRAHAAENLLVIGESARVMPMLAALAPATRFGLIAALVERVWQRARVAGVDDLPGAAQVEAKDWLVQLRGMASMQTVAIIDQYLLDWYATPSLEARARLGTHDAAQVMTLLGEMAGPRMRLALEQLLARPTAKNAYVRVGDDLLAAIAATREPAALRAAWKVALAPRGDASLPGRWIAALHRAHVAATQHGASLAAAIEALQPELMDVATARAPWSATSAMQAFELLGSLPEPACVEAMSELVTHHAAGALAWAAAGYLVQCGTLSKEVLGRLRSAALKLADAGPPARATPARSWPKGPLLLTLAAHGDPMVRWMAAQWAGWCVQPGGDAADAAACRQLLHAMHEDAATVKVNGRTVALRSVAEALLAKAQ